MNQVIGQERVKQQLRTAVNSGRMSHAQILLGPKGAGGLALALATAQYLLCQNKTDDKVCGTCPACHKAAKNIHPDIHFTFPTIGGKATSEDFMNEWRSALDESPYFDDFKWLQKIGGEGKQGNITALECNRMISKLSLKSFESPYKVQIIWQVEYLQKEGNRLLKLIEEPPANTYFLLIAHDSDQVLNTILSRCQIVKFGALKDTEIAAALQQRNQVSEEKANSIAHLADGSFSEAQSILQHADDENSVNRSALFLDWLRKCYLGDGVAMTKLSEALAKLGREPQKFFLRYGLHFFREFLFFKTTGTENVRLLPSELETARKMNQVLDFEKVEKITQLFSDCIYHVERNANPKVLFLDASIQLNKIFRRS